MLALLVRKRLCLQICTSYFRKVIKSKHFGISLFYVLGSSFNQARVNCLSPFILSAFLKKACQHKLVVRVSELIGLSIDDMDFLLQEANPFLKQSFSLILPDGLEFSSKHFHRFLHLSNRGRQFLEDFWLKFGQESLVQFQQPRQDVLTALDQLVNCFIPKLFKLLARVLQIEKLKSSKIERKPVLHLFNLLLVSLCNGRCLVSVQVFFDQA